MSLNGQSLHRAAGRFDPGAFYRIVYAAVAAGILAGLLLTGVQQLQVAGIILQAEVYEDAADAAKEQASGPAPRATTPASGAAKAQAAPAGHEHEHHHDDWKPENGFERTAFSVIANITIAIGYGLLLAAAFHLRGGAIGWRQGMLWGAAGYLVFFLAPSLGLRPEVPGTAAAPLADRQIWWLATAALTAGGLSLLAFTRPWLLKLVALAMLVAPHLVGAPQPEVEHSAAPAALALSFIEATALSNAVLWLALGGLAGLFYAGRRPA